MESPEFAKYLLTLSPEERTKVMEQLMAIMTAVDPVGGTEAIEKLMNNLTAVDPAAFVASNSKEDLASKIEDTVNKLMIIMRLGLSINGLASTVFEKLSDAQLENIRAGFGREAAALAAAEARGETVTAEQWKEVTDKINGLATPEERAAARSMVDWYKTPNGRAGLFGATVVITLGILLGGNVDWTKPNEVMDVLGWMCWIATGASALADLGFDMEKVKERIQKMPHTNSYFGGWNLTPAEKIQNFMKVNAMSAAGFMPNIFKGIGILNPIGSFLFFASSVYLAPEQLKEGDKVGAGLGLTGGSLFGIGGISEVYGLMSAFRMIAAPIAAIPIIGGVAYVIGIIVFLAMSILKPEEMSIEDLAKAGIIPPNLDDEGNRTNFWNDPNDKEESSNGS